MILSLWIPRQRVLLQVRGAVQIDGLVRVLVNGGVCDPSRGAALEIIKVLGDKAVQAYHAKSL
jgi:hypothetical protein